MTDRPGAVRGRVPGVPREPEPERIGRGLRDGSVQLLLQVGQQRPGGPRARGIAGLRRSPDTGRSARALTRRRGSRCRRRRSVRSCRRSPSGRLAGSTPDRCGQDRSGDHRPRRRSRARSRPARGRPATRSRDRSCTGSPSAVLGRRVARSKMCSAAVKHRAREGRLARLEHLEALANAAASRPARLGLTSDPGGRRGRRAGSGCTDREDRFPRTYRLLVAAARCRGHRASSRSRSRSPPGSRAFRSGRPTS